MNTKVRNQSISTVERKLVPFRQTQEGCSKHLMSLVQKYCDLSKLQDPTDSDLNKLAAILELSQYDPELSNLINQADHLIAYELGLCDSLPSDIKLSWINNFSDGTVFI